MHNVLEYNHNFGKLHQLSPHLTTTRCRNPKKRSLTGQQPLWKPPKLIVSLTVVHGTKITFVQQQATVGSGYHCKRTEHVAYKTYCLRSHLVPMHSITLWSKV